MVVSRLEISPGGVFQFAEPRKPVPVRIEAADLRGTAQTLHRLMRVMRVGSGIGIGDRRYHHMDGANRLRLHPLGPSSVLENLRLETRGVLRTQVGGERQERRAI